MEIEIDTDNCLVQTMIEDVRPIEITMLVRFWSRVWD